jgi:Leucine-rich repeat (LRR) protein
MRCVTITFEDAWHRRLPSPEDLPQLLPDIQDAAPDDRQVAVYPPPTWGTGSVRGEQPAALDGLTDKPWVESVVLGWRASSGVELPGVRSLIGLNQFCDVDGDTLARLPNVQQLVQDRVNPGAEALAGLRSLERLRIEGVHYQEPVDPIAQLIGLRWLSLEGWRNLRVLGRLTNLEGLELLEFEMTNLRPFRQLARLRELSLMGRLKSLDGIEALTALEDVWLRGRVVRDLTPLAELPRLSRLTLIYPDAVNDFGLLGRLAGLRQLELMLGDDTDSGRLPSIGFLSSLAQLEELRLFNVDIEDRRLDPLFELPSLRRVHLTGNVGPNVDDLRRRRPELDLEIHMVGDPEGRVHVGPVHYEPPFDGVGRWAIYQSLADLLGVEANVQAESRIRAELLRRDPQLLARIQFDSEAGAVGVYAASESDIRAVAGLVRRMIGQAQGNE